MKDWNEREFVHLNLFIEFIADIFLSRSQILRHRCLSKDTKGRTEWRTHWSSTRERVSRSLLSSIASSHAGSVSVNAHLTL